jgi:hypothetical protein
LQLLNNLPPLMPGEFDALQRATRWTGLLPYLFGADAPLFGARQFEHAVALLCSSMFIGNVVWIKKFSQIY